MTTTTISLERSAYELLRARKKPDESFSEELHRLLGSASPELKGFLDIVPPEDGPAIADAIETIRAQDFNEERMRALRGRPRNGHRA
ncbi:MAG: antitoxin VapB family protein [Thermoplasmata archaeon]|nr:antitoxin VapB family protein [Thermoplasmata archaeon]